MAEVHRMEALSPRSANIQMKPKLLKQKEAADQEAQKAEAVRKALKEKDYAPPPPEWVLQPPIAKGGLAEKFRTGKCLGKGGFAICYEGELRSKKSGTRSNVFALKVVKTKMNQRKMEEKFRTELQIHAKMQHPNIVEFHRAFTFKESTFVVLELCSNGSVMDMVKKRRCLSLPEVRRYTVQLCGAIKYMHARNVIHRDLKMGNLFLDQDMNLKIGDFGLAAVLVSPEEYQKGLYDHAKSRRTTLCGTPNYIAPEILEKGRGGHDYKVDIWAIGVIVFAMLVGQPPFQSASQNEIYRRARSVEYAWPQTGKHQNDIPEEAKDLVSQLLKVDAEERPDPDQVIGHPFFAMHGGNALPLVMEEYFRRERPKFLDLQRLPRGDVMLKGTDRLSLRTFARQCGVGHLTGDMFSQPAVGGDIDISLYGQCQAEEIAGSAPIVPMPKDMVYVSKFAPTNTQGEANSHLNLADTDVVMDDVPSSRPVAAEHHRPAPIQSHAAALRAAHAPSKSTRSQTDSDRATSSNGTTRSRNPAVATVRARRGLINELPVRPTLKSTDVAGLEAKNLARNLRASRSKKTPALDDGNPENSSEAQQAPKPFSKDQYIDEAYSDPDAKRRDLSARTRARIATNVQKELAEPEPTARKSSVEITAVRTRPNSESPKPVNALIGPDEAMECLPNTKPDDVLHQLQELHKNLEASLNDIGKAKDHSEVQSMISKNRDIKQRPVVVKWVDYTNKFGIGYILQNGTVGCVFKGDETSFPTCVVVADTESHLNKRKNPAYPDNHQLVPRQGSPIEFIENCDTDGLKRVFVSPSRYQLSVSAAGVPGRLGPGFDIHDFEKRKKLSLWDKFGRYMTQSLGKSDEADSQSLEQPSTSRSRRNNVAGPFLKFYQRLGNVGIWGYGDGSFQINFPDHTKLFISNDGAWLDFYHLPVSAAYHVQAGGHASVANLADRSVLAYPTSVMLTGVYRSHKFLDVVTANQLGDKLAFVKGVVGLWSIEGGLGCMGPKKGVKWEGMREEGSKLVWVTVGAKGGDGRYEMREEGGKLGLYEMKEEGGKMGWVAVEERRER